MAVNSKFVLGWHGTYCRMQIIGLGFVVKYTYAQGQVTKSEDMPRPDARGRGRGRGQHVEAEDKISASRTVWPRGLNITDGYCKMFTYSTRLQSRDHTGPGSLFRLTSHSLKHFNH